MCVIQQQQVSLWVNNVYKLALPNASSSLCPLETQLTQLLVSSGCKWVSGTAGEVSLVTPSYRQTLLLTHTPLPPPSPQGFIMLLAVTLCKHCERLLLKQTVSWNIKTSGNLTHDSCAVWSVWGFFWLFLWLTENRRTVTCWRICDKKALSRKHKGDTHFLSPLVSHPILVGELSFSCSVDSFLSSGAGLLH